MADVFKGYHRELAKKAVAIKVIKRGNSEDPAARERFREEWAACGQLDHENIVRSYDAGEMNGQLFLVMEFVDGESLHDYTTRCGGLPVWEACSLIQQAAEGLRHAHECGIVHRDIKPGNIMRRSKDGLAKIVDFGLAKVTQDNGTNATVGTAECMSPEQEKDSDHADIRSDIYGLGCTLYFLLANRFPFGSRKDKVSVEEIQRAHARKPVPSIANADIPPGLWAVLEKMLKKKPGDRFQTPAEVAVALEPYTKRGSNPPPWPWWAIIATVLAISAIGALSVGALMFFLGGDPPNGGGGGGGGGGTLQKVVIVFDTLDQGKKGDDKTTGEEGTGVFVEVYEDGTGEKLVSIEGEAKDIKYGKHETHNIEILVAPGIPRSRCEHFRSRIGMKAPLEDDWHFKAKVELIFSEGPTIWNHLEDATLVSENGDLVWAPLERVP
jgi:tRNA A-37 threonylcarbamoyl transferase component Bud32